LNAPTGAVSCNKPRRMLSPGAGGYDFAPSAGPGGRAVLWTPTASPSVVTITQQPDDIADPKFILPADAIDIARGSGDADRVIEHLGSTHRVHLHEDGAGQPAVLLPLDRLFEIRAGAAVRLWRSLTGRNPGPNPAALPKARRDRLILGLRALDGRLENATYRDIAAALFGAPDASGRAWKGHDLRDRTIRLVKFGFAMMRGGYRSLLLYPHRRRK
jgi:hypothetical protein